MFKSSWFPVIALLAVAGLLIAASPLAAQDAAVTGTFKGNGQDAKLAFVTAQKGEPKKDDPGKGEPRYVLVFTEKDPAEAKGKDVRHEAAFGRLGSALIVVCTPNGRIVDMQVAHTALKAKQFTALGDIERLDEFKIDGGTISGKLATPGIVKAFDDTYEVNLKFQTKAP